MKPAKKSSARLARRLSGYERDHAPQVRHGKRAFTIPGSRKK